MTTYRVVKTITPEQGWSCAFRQWRAESHCRFLHGYALGCELTFEGDELDTCNWLIDFGGMKPLREALAAQFDHCTVIAEDDPHLLAFRELDLQGAMQLRVMPAVGCEMFAKYVLERTHEWLWHEGLVNRVRVVSAKVFEHASNAAVAVA